MNIDKQRLRATFDALTTDGRTPEGGLNRPALSTAHLAARQRFAEMITAGGFAVHTDGAGNVSARWQAAGPAAPTLMIGSHLDSVPEGGRFDGALGVAAAYEVLLALHECGEAFNANLEVIDFTDEEGTWVSLMGSRAISGQLTARDLANPRGNPAVFEKRLARAGLTRSGILAASRAEEEFKAYLELHIEQGTRLESSGTNIGVVTGMVGIFMYLVTFRGTANHAGTTPMDRRRDAAQGASAFALQVRTIIMDRFPDCVATVGNMTFEPGAFNIVARSVACFMEFRSSDIARAHALQRALRTMAFREAERFNLEVDFEHLETVQPRTMDGHVQRTFHAAAAHLGLTTTGLPSLAGHDAQSMALLGPAGLIFVPSVGGFSHSAREHTRWEDCIRGCSTLFEAARRLLSDPPDAAPIAGARQAV